jgi:hypothetical protein
MPEYGELGSLFPRKYIPGAIPPPAIVMVMVDWLLQELDNMAYKKYPILRTIKGHRRREIIAFLEAMPDWTGDILNTKMVV